MNRRPPRGTRAGLPRRNLLTLVSATLPTIVVSCNDEPVTVTAAPAGPIEHEDVLREYFGEQGLSDAEAIGNYHAQFQQLTPTEAFDETAATRALIDASDDIDHALTALDQRVSDDFLELQLVDVAGWTLSRTEVELCLMVWVG